MTVVDLYYLDEVVFVRFLFYKVFFLFLLYILYSLEGSYYVPPTFKVLRIVIFFLRFVPCPSFIYLLNHFLISGDIYQNFV